MTILSVVVIMAAVVFLMLLVFGLAFLIKGINGGGPIITAVGVVVLIGVFSVVLLVGLLSLSWWSISEDRIAQESTPATTAEPDPASAAAPPLTPRPTAPTPTAPPTIVRRAEGLPQANAMPAVWQETDSDLFTARIYPSLLATGKPLARKLSDKLRTDQPNGESNEPVLPTAIHVTGHQLAEKHRSGLLERFTQQLRKEFPDAEVVVVDAASSDQGRTEVEDGVVWVGLQMKGVQNEGVPWDSNVGQEKGIHACHAETAHGEILAECEYIEKPWLENFDVFVSQRPSKRFVVGYSNSLASSEDEARRLAMEDAEAKSLAQIGPGTFVSASEQFVVDRFAQRLSRHYGDVWREAVLMDVSPDRMAPVISAAHTQIIVKHQREQSALLGLFVLLGFTALLCVVLNAITQGYYRSRLLVGIGAAIVLVVAGIWFLKARESVSEPIVTSMTGQP